MSPNDPRQVLPADQAKLACPSSVVDQAELAIPARSATQTPGKRDPFYRWVIGMCVEVVDLRAENNRLRQGLSVEPRKPREFPSPQTKFPL